MGQEAGLGEARDSFEDIAKQEGFAVGVTEERKETEFSEGGDGDRRHIYSYGFRGGENSPKVIIYNVYGDKVGVSGDNVRKEKNVSLYGHSETYISNGDK